jgi:hypothetical protein
MKTKRTVFSAVSIGIILLLGSCSGDAGEAKPVNKAETSEEINALVANPAAGLAGLKSYHMQLVQEFDGELDGQPIQTKVEHTGDEVKSTNTEFVDLQQIAENGKTESFLTGVIGNASYRRSGDENATCHITWNENEKNAPSLWPVDMIPIITAGKKTGEEEINGVKAAHYTLDDASLGVFYFEKVDGDLWMKEPDGFIVKLELNLKGSENAFGKGRSGTKKLSYELTKINANDDFISPKGCQPVLTGVPIMTDAVREYRLPDILRYYSPSNPEKVLAFYKEQLSAQGWLMGSPHESSSKGQVILFIKTETDERMHLSLTPNKDTTLVSVSISKAPEIVPTKPGDETKIESTPEGNSIDPANAGLPEGVPIYPGAQNFTGISGMMLNFTTSDPESKVLDFYKTNLGKGKWTQSPVPANQTGVPVMFRKDNINLMIKISEKDGISQVQLVVFKQ